MLDGLFKNTAGGKYRKENNAKVASYTFPAQACVVISGVNIPLGGLVVQAWGRGFPAMTQRHFTQLSSLITPKKYNTHISSLMLDDKTFVPPYPSAATFQEYKLEYMSQEEYTIAKEKNEFKDALKLMAVEQMYHDVYWKNCKAHIDIVEDILDSNEQFPKQISMMYFTQNHLSHIVLFFQCRHSCILYLDDTLSLKKEEYPLRESLKNDNDKDSTYFELNYRKMCSNIKNLLMFMQIELKQIKILPNLPYQAQKETEECVPFATQNRFEFLMETNYETTESVIWRGIRLRAEHTVLSYLLMGIEQIPGEMSGSDWYPNYKEVCASLNAAIEQLPLAALEHLALAFEIDKATLSTSFKDLIANSIQIKSLEKMFEQKVSINVPVFIDSIPTKALIFSEPEKEAMPQKEPLLAHKKQDKQGLALCATQ